jgi:hypothetical protein
MDTCPFCKSADIGGGYGYAAGIFGGYEFCNSCDEFINIMPDIDGLSAKEISLIKREAIKWKKEMLKRASQSATQP